MSDAYWEDCIAEAFDAAGLAATKEQISEVAAWAEGAHENYGMAHGYDAIPSQESIELSEAKRALEKERSKIHCEPCNGKGWITSDAGFRSITSQCYACRGEGRVLL